MEYAFSKRVILANPATLWALLKTIAFTWQQDVLTEDAKRLFDLGKELYSRLSTLSEHADKLRRSIESTVTSYNQFASSLEQRVLVTARKLDALDESKVIATPPAIDEQPKRLSQPELRRRRRGRSCRAGGSTRPASAGPTSTSRSPSRRSRRRRRTRAPRRRLRGGRAADPRPHRGFAAADHAQPPRGDQRPHPGDARGDRRGAGPVARGTGDPGDRDRGCGRPRAVRGRRHQAPDRQHGGRRRTVLAHRIPRERPHRGASGAVRRAHGRHRHGRRHRHLRPRLGARGDRALPPGHARGADRPRPGCRGRPPARARSRRARHASRPDRGLVRRCGRHRHRLRRSARAVRAAARPDAGARHGDGARSRGRGTVRRSAGHLVPAGAALLDR